MSDVTDMLAQSQRSLEKAGKDDNSLDHTVFFSGRATTYAVLAAMMSIQEVKEELKEIKALLVK